MEDLCDGEKMGRLLAVAETMAGQTPRSATPWLRLAASLHMLEQTEDACETLLEVLDEFPDNPAFAYQLACYFCQLEEFAEAKQWLQTAFSIGNQGTEVASLARPRIEAVVGQDRTELSGRNSYPGQPSEVDCFAQMMRKEDRRRAENSKEIVSL